MNGGISWQVSGNYTGLIPGIYSVRMRDAAHSICWMNLNSNLVISEPLLLSMTSTGNIVLNCNGDNNGAGSFFAAGGTMPYTFAIISNTTGATIPAPGFNSQSFTGAGAGTVTVQVTDSHGCSSQTTITVTQPAILTSGSIAASQVLCSGQNPAQLTEATPATGGPAAYNYQWQYGIDVAGPFINIAGGTAYQYTPPASTTTTLYYRRMVTSGSCNPVYSNIIEVKVNPVPFAVLSGGETICPGQSSILIVNISNGVGPYEVEIENLGVVSGYNSGGNISVSPASTTTYKLLRVRDSNGCEVISPTTNLSGFATVVVRALPVIATSPSGVTTCEMNMVSFTVSATGSDLTYQWYVDEGSGFNMVTDGGVYYGANYYTLSIFGTTRLMNNNKYHVLVTGCGVTLTSADAVLTINTVPEITGQPSDTTICMNGGASFTVSATGTALTYKWQVNNGSGFGDISDNINYSGTNSNNLILTSIPGTFNNYTFRVRISGTCGVPIYSNFVVLRVLTPPSVTLNPVPKSVCNGGGPVVFSATGTGLIDSLRWQVYSGGTWSDIHDNSVYSGTSSQQLTLNSVPLAYNGNQYRLALKAKCITVSSTAATLTVNPNPVVDFSAVSPLNACGGVPLVINGNPSGGSGSYLQHPWTGDVGPLNNYFIQSPTFNTIIPGTYNLNYKVKDSNGCYGDDDVTVIVDKPDAAFSVDAAFGCTPVVTTFSKDMTGIAKFWWDFGDGSPTDSLNANPSHLFSNTNPSSIEYYNVTLTVQSAGGCTDTFTSVIQFTRQ